MRKQKNRHDIIQNKLELLIAESPSSSKYQVLGEMAICWIWRVWKGASDVPFSHPEAGMHEIAHYGLFDLEANFKSENFYHFEHVEGKRLKLGKKLNAFE